MISKCANPACSTSFHYMRDGKLFHMEFDPERQPLVPQRAGHCKPVRKIEHFWLCGPCCAALTLVMNKGTVDVAPIEGAALGRAAGS